MNHYNENIRERSLLKRTIETGDKDAISKIYLKHTPFLKSYLASLSNLNGYAEDLTHDLFLAISNRQCKYNGDTDVQGYLCGIAKRLVSKHNRQEMKHGLIFTGNFSEQIARRKSGDPVEKVNTEEIRTATCQAISRLPEKSRQAIELVFIHNLRPYQAAKRIGCSPVVLRGRLLCGLNILRRKLKNFPKKFEL